MSLQLGPPQQLSVHPHQPPTQVPKAPSLPWAEREPLVSPCPQGGAVPAVPPHTPSWICPPTMGHKGQRSVGTPLPPQVRLVGQGVAGITSPRDPLKPEVPRAWAPQTGSDGPGHETHPKTHSGPHLLPTGARAGGLCVPSCPLGWEPRVSPHTPRAAPVQEQRTKRRRRSVKAPQPPAMTAGAPQVTRGQRRHDRRWALGQRGFGPWGPQGWGALSCHSGGVRGTEHMRTNRTRGTDRAGGHQPPVPAGRTPAPQSSASPTQTPHGHITPKPTLTPVPGDPKMCSCSSPPTPNPCRTGSRAPLNHVTPNPMSPCTQVTPSLSLHPHPGWDPESMGVSGVQGAGGG